MLSRLSFAIALVLMVSSLVLFQNCGGVEGGNQLVVPSTGGGAVTYSARLTRFITTPASNPTGFELLASIVTQSRADEYQYRVSITRENGDSVPNCTSTTLRTINQQMDFSCSSGAVLSAGSYQLLVSGRHPSETRFKTLLSASAVVQSSGGGGTTTVTANPPSGLMVNPINGAPNSLSWTAPNPVFSPAGTAPQTVQYLVTLTGPSPSSQTLTVDNIAGTNVALTAFAANGLAAGEYQWAVQTKATTAMSAMPVMSSSATGTRFTIAPSASQTPMVVEFSAQVIREGSNCRVNGLISGPSIPDTRWVRVLGPNNAMACVRGQSNGSFTMTIPDGGPHSVSMNGMYTDANCSQGFQPLTLGEHAVSVLQLLCSTTTVTRQVNAAYPETCIAASGQSFCPDTFQVQMSLSNVPPGHTIGIFTRGPGGPSGNHACLGGNTNHVSNTNNGNGFSWIGVNPGNHITYEARLYNSPDCSNGFRGSLGDRFTVRGGCAGGIPPVDQRCP